MLAPNRVLPKLLATLRPSKSIIFSCNTPTTNFASTSILVLLEVGRSRLEVITSLASRASTSTSYCREVEVYYFNNLLVIKTIIYLYLVEIFITVSL